MIRKIKKGFSKIYVVDIEKENGHTISVEFPTESGALLYEKLLDIENAISNLGSEEEALSEEEKALLEKLQKKVKK